MYTLITNVLIIDDEEILLHLFSRLLTRRGYTTVTRDNADEILQTVADTNPDLILMDHNMPGTTGADAIKELKAHDAYKNIPIVLVSANNNIAELAKDAGADAYFLKSKGYDQLVEIIATL